VHEVTTAMRTIERALAAAPRSPGWHRSLGERLKSLRGAYIRYLEASMGGTSDAVEHNPSLSPRLRMLRREQARIADEIDRLTEACERAVDVETLRQQVVALLGRIARIRQREVGLLYESVDMELGGEE
jgi:hypothetical protein